MPVARPRLLVPATRRYGGSPHRGTLQASVDELLLAVQLLSALVQKGAHCSCKGGDDGDRPELHEDVENAASRRDGVTQVGGDRQKLGGSPEQGAAEGVDLCSAGLSLNRKNTQTPQIRSTPTVATAIAVTRSRRRRWVVVLPLPTW